MAIIRGDYKILYIKIGGEFVPIGCLTDNSFSETTGTIETTTRENTDGWSSAAPTNQSYSIPFAGVSTLNDMDGSIADYDALQNLKRTRSVVEWQIKSGEGGNTESGTGLITDLSNSAPVGGEVTFSGTILGSGLPIVTPGVQADAPTNFRNQDPASTNCFVEWDKSITGPMLSYRIYHDGVFFREFLGDVSLGTLTGLAPSTTYTNMTCRGWDGNEESPDSNSISFTTAATASIIVEDNLTSTSPTNALSANQGRILNETKVSSVQEGSNVTVDATDPINPIVSSVQRPVVDNLISTAVDQSLSANQGTILNNTKLNDVFAGSNVTVDKSDPLAPIISSVPGTTAGSTRRVYFTGDALILSETFYETNGSNQGTVESIEQQVTNTDNQTTFFAVDFIGAAASNDETLIGGNYTGHLQVAVNSQAGNQSYAIEIYIANDQGVPFNSGIVGAPIGDLGVEVLAIGYTGVFDIEPDNPTSIVFAFTLDANVDIVAGTRVRYHVSATKEGTDGGDVVMSLYSGSDWLTYLDAPASVTTEGVINPDDTITGATQYDVNRSVDANKIGIEGGEDYRMTGMIYGGELLESTMPGGQNIQKIRQLGGILTYQGIETSPGSDAYTYSEGLGESVLENNQGRICIALGSFALRNNIGDNAVALGTSAGQENTGSSCTFIGYFSGQNNEGNFNEFLGYRSGVNNVGNSNTFIGQSSGENNGGSNCVGIGGSLQSNTGSYNIGIGFNTLVRATGSNNVAIGYYAGATDFDVFFTFQNTISLGNRALAEKDNQVMLGDENIESVRAGNPDYVAVDEDDLVPKRQVALSTVTGEMTGAAKASNQVVISEADYGDGSAAVTGTLYFIKP